MGIISGTISAGKKVLSGGKKTVGFINPINGGSLPNSPHNVELKETTRNKVSQVLDGGIKGTAAQLSRVLGVNKEGREQIMKDPDIQLALEALYRTFINANISLADLTTGGLTSMLVTLPKLLRSKGGKKKDHFLNPDIKNKWQVAGEVDYFMPGLPTYAVITGIQAVMDIPRFATALGKLLKILIKNNSLVSAATYPFKHPIRTLMSPLVATGNTAKLLTAPVIKYKNLPSGLGQFTGLKT